MSKPDNSEAIIVRVERADFTETDWIYPLLTNAADVPDYWRGYFACYIEELSAAQPVSSETFRDFVIMRLRKLLEDMTTLFQIAVGHDAEAKTYSAVVHCLPDNRIARVPDNANLRVVMAGVSKLVRKKTQAIKNFPLPSEPSPIIDPKEANGSRGLIVLPR